MQRNTVMIIDKKALLHNFQVIKQHVGHALIFAVLKGNAYGHHIDIVGKALKNVDGFVVFSLEEAALLRQQFLNKPILWLAGFSTLSELKSSIKLNITSVIHHSDQIKILELQRLKTPLNIFLEIDTGLNRLGFSPESFFNAYQRLIQFCQMKAQFTIMSHFAQAEDIHHPMTTQQITLFNQLTKHLPNPVSLANSAAIWAWPEAIRDCVRPGIALYGISPFEGQYGSDLGLKPVMTLQAKLIAIHPCKKGVPAGYGGCWVSSRDTYLGLVNIGYADGYPRYANNGTPVLINNVLYPLIGRVSMNMITVDLGPTLKANIHDTVTLWGKGLPVEKIAMHSNTIPDELVAGISSNIKIIHK